MKVAIACGGTGGHLYPGLATARVLLQRGHSVTLWLAGRDVEERVRGVWDGDVVTVRARGFPSGFSLASIGRLVRLLGAILRSVRLMGDARPDILLAMGSYASVGPVVAAALRRVPIVLHEANVIPGRAVSLLSRMATAIGVTFDEAARHLPRGSVVRTGLPLRPEALGARAAPQSQGSPCVLVMGGSQGAQRLNDIAVEALCGLHESGKRFAVTHLTGKDDADKVATRYATCGLDATVHAYLEDMRSVYSQCSFAVARSGAGSCMELAAWGVPALFVPLPEARRNHQAANAQAMVDAGGADAISQAALTVDRLVGHLTDILYDTDRLDRMSRAMRSMAVTDGAERLADLVEQAAGTDAAARKG